MSLIRKQKTIKKASVILKILSNHRLLLTSQALSRVYNHCGRAARNVTLTSAYIKSTRQIALARLSQYSLHHWKDCSIQGDGRDYKLRDFAGESCRPETYPSCCGSNGRRWDSSGFYNVVSKSSKRCQEDGYYGADILTILMLRPFHIVGITIAQSKHISWLTGGRVV